MTPLELRQRVSLWPLSFQAQCHRRALEILMSRVGAEAVRRAMLQAHDETARKVSAAKHEVEEARECRCGAPIRFRTNRRGRVERITLTGDLHACPL